MVADNKTSSRRKKGLCYVDRLKLAKKNKKSRKKPRQNEEEANATELEEQQTAKVSPSDCELIPLTSPRKCVSERDAHAQSSSTNVSSSASSFHSLSLRLEDTYSNSKLSDAASDLDDPVRLSVNQSLYHGKGPAPDLQLSRAAVNESVRWELSLECPDDEKERLRVYKLNRRKRYLAKQHMLDNVKEQPVVAMGTKMSEMKVSPRKRGK